MKVEDLYSQMYSMAEYEIVREMASFNESIVLINLNYQELSRHFEDFKQSIVNFSPNELNKNINIETKRLIHNYLCSAISLVDHTRVYMNKLHSEEQLLEYQKKIKSTFIENYLCIFVKDLRQYIQHYRLPQISFQKNAHSIKSHASMIISKEELIKFSGWTKKSSEYIQSYIGNIDLRIVLKKYQAIVTEFYCWLIDWQRAIFEKEINAVETLKEGIKQTKLAGVLQKILNSSYKNYSQLERDLVYIIPDKIVELSKADEKRKLNEIFNLFEADTITKFLIVQHLEIVINKG